MSILWWILLALAAYSAVMFMSSMSKTKKERFRETFEEEGRASSKSVPELVDTLLRNVAAVQKTANDLSKLFPASGKDKKGGFKEGFKYRDAEAMNEKESDAEDDGKTKEHMLEGAPLDKKQDASGSDTESESESEAEKKPVTKKKEGFCGAKKKKQNGFPYKGVQTSFTYNSSLLEGDD